MQWWSTQGKPLRILQAPELHEQQYVYPNISELIGGFSMWLADALSGGGKVSAKGIDFDLAIVETAYTDLGRKVPWRYNQSRCMRGFLDACAQAGISPHLHMGVQGGNEMPHHAAEDAIFQTKVYARYAHELWKIRHRTAQKGLFDTLTSAGAAPTLEPAP